MRERREKHLRATSVFRRQCRLGVLARAAALAAVALFLFLVGSPALSQPTQDEVLKSIGDNVNEPIDSAHVIAVVAGIGGSVILLVLVGQWRQREPGSKSVNHHGKLMKEVLKNVSLKGSELKQIKSLAQDLRPRGRDERVESPLTLLLCPTLLGEAAKQSRGKADLPIVAGLVKRLVARS